jgi:carbon-monoxide dehydrogenase medium subunit
MLLRSVGYERPASVADAVAALGTTLGPERSRGGQSLINVLKHRVAAVDLLVDINGLAELRVIGVRADGSAAIGAGCTCDELEHSDTLRTAHPEVCRVAGALVDQRVRCRGTLGGNACYNDPASNIPPLLELASSEDGSRTSVRWSADAQLDGVVGSLGPRILPAVLAGQVERVLTAVTR